MNNKVTTKTKDTQHAVTSAKLAAMIGTMAIELHQGQRITPATTGRTYDRSRPNCSEQESACQNGPSTYDGMKNCDKNLFFVTV
jgi:hypothetical protein